MNESLTGCQGLEGFIKFWYPRTVKRSVFILQWKIQRPSRFTVSLEWGPRVVVATARSSDHRPGWRVDLPGGVSRDSWCHQRPDGPHLAFCRHNILKESHCWLKLKACRLMEKGSGNHRFQKRKKKLKNLWFLNTRKPSFMHWESLCSYLWMKCKTTGLPFLDIKIIQTNYCASINTYYYFLGYLNRHVTHNNYFFFIWV